MRTVDWVIENVESISKLSVTRRVDFQKFPHVIEVLDAFDDDLINEISLQWAARAGKTQFILFCLAATIANYPSPMLFADSAEDSVREVLSRLWEVLNGTPALKDVIPPVHLQTTDKIATRVATILGAWSTAPRTAADRACRIVVCNECDKMKVSSTRTEADFRMAVRNRCRGFKRSKIINASTPSVVGLSYVNGRCLAGDSRRRKVPCPRCGHFQELKTGDGKTPGGMRFEKLNGKLHAEKAFDTAWYQCEVCEGRIEESERFRMCNDGLWVPEGCRVVNGQLVGTPVRAGSHASFMELHALNNLLDGITINSEAKEFVESLTHQNRTEAIRSWINDHEGKPWDPAPSAEVVSEIEGRMAVDRPLDIVPAWAKFLTLGADVGAYKLLNPKTNRLENDYVFHYWISAWGDDRRGGLISIGDAYGRDAFIKLIKEAKFSCPEKRGHYGLAFAVVDSGYHATSMYEMCDQHRVGGKFLVTPIKGSNKDGDKPFVNDTSDPRMAYGGFRGQMPDWQKKLWKKLLSTGARIANRYELIYVHTTATELWVEDRINGRVGRDNPGFYDVPRELFTPASLEQWELPLQMAGDYFIDGAWLKRRKRQDHRDAWRYDRAAAEVYTEGKWESLTDTLILDEAAKPKETVAAVSGIPGLNGGSFIAALRD